MHSDSGLDEALDAVEGASPLDRVSYQTRVFQITEALMGSQEGLQVLHDGAHRFDTAGVFSGGPWVDPARLQPRLVTPSLVGSGVYPVIETLSELRVLAIATERVQSDAMTALEARRFLEAVMALNLNLVFPSHAEQERIEGGPHLASNIRLFALIADAVGLHNLRDEVTDEIVALAAQRPILNTGLRRMIHMAARIPDTAPPGPSRLTPFAQAVSGPSPLSRRVDEAGYQDALADLPPDAVIAEADALGASMQQTGLASPFHAILLRALIHSQPHIAVRALGLGPLGAASFEANVGIVRRLVDKGVFRETAHCVYGLSRLIERGLLGRREVGQGLRRVADLKCDIEVQRALLNLHPHHSLTANAILLAGCISVLGQPLGIGQGNNLTCQAARGLSMWSQHAPGYLLELVIAAARDGHVRMQFEGQDLRSDQLGGGLVQRLDPDLDPVSLVLVPHLDRLHDEMMRRVALRGEDGHKWTNPALYGRWVPNDFASVFADIAQTRVDGSADFVRNFYAAHHPAHNGGHKLMYPNPLGLCLTNGNGDYLGPHGVSLQRIAAAPDGTLRAYFFNPNNEGRQDWGHGVQPSVQGHGEHPGESSLPFQQLASRTYAFHYNPFELGDPDAVPEREVDEVVEAARTTWGQAFLWQPPGGLLRI